MKSLLGKIGTVLVAIIVFGFVIDTGSFPPDNTLVFVDSDIKKYYPPTRTPENAGYQATAYLLAKRMGAKPDVVTGFNVDGPPLIISFLVSAGIVPSWPSYWAGTSVALEYYDEELVQQMLDDM